MNPALGESSLGRFAGEVRSNMARPAMGTPKSESDTFGRAAIELSPALLVVPRESRGEVRASGEAKEAADVYPFPYLLLIRAAIREGDFNAAKKLLSLATDQGRIESDELSRLQQLLGPAKVRRSAVTGVDRAPEFQWLTAHGSDFAGRWVAISGNRLVAHASALADLLSELRTHNLVRKPLIHKIS